LSFVDFARLPQTLQQVHKKLGEFGLKPCIGIPWPWQRDLPTGMLPGDYVSLAVNPPTIEAQRITYLNETQNAAVQRWVNLAGPENSSASDLENSASQRAGDFAQQMLNAKLHGAQGIFVPQVCTSDRGVLKEDGAPGELLLPWRTMALALAGSDYL